MKYEKGDLIIEHLCDSFYLIILDKIKGNNAEGHIIFSTDEEDNEDYTPFEEPSYTEDGSDCPIDLEFNCELFIKHYQPVTIEFISTFKNYENEKSGRKANTVRIKLPKWKKEKLRESTHIKMRKGYTKEFFIRKITDKTFWDGVDIVSWDSGEGK